MYSYVQSPHTLNNKNKLKDKDKKVTCKHKETML